MNITLRKSQIRTLKKSDPNFNIVDQFVVAPRAGFEIDLGCPKEYRAVISECIERGWLRPVANVTERELIFMGLSRE